MRVITETIAAIATPPGVGGIAVVRVSGPDAYKLIQPLIQNQALLPNQAKALKFHSLPGELLDQVVVTYFKAPHSYTGEDTLEISCHGSLYLSNRILEECLTAGARLAEPGEFTKRAFLTGKIDLAQVEAVAEMLSAKTELSNQLALKHLEGDISRQIKNFRDKFVLLLAELEASLDFPEEIEGPAIQQIRNSLEESLVSIDEMIVDSSKGQLVAQGITLVLAGRTNVGKSALFNRLCRHSRAIVADVHGTTRDYLEAQISLQGIPATLVDTAGIRDSADQVELLGIARSKEYISAAEIVLFVFEATGLTAEDENLLAQFAGQRVIKIANKADLLGPLGHFDFAQCKSARGPNGAIFVSSKTGEGVAELEKKIISLMDLDNLDINKKVYVSSLRQKEKLIRAAAAIRKALNGLKDLDYLDLAAVEVKEIIFVLGEITGDEVTEAVIEEIFANFCVGK